MTNLNFEERMKLLKRIRLMADSGIKSGSTLATLEYIQKTLKDEFRGD